MALEFCSCKSKGKVAGRPGCVPSAKDTAFLFMFPTRDSAQAFNGILSTDTLNNAFFRGKIEETDKSKAWRVLPLMTTPEFVRADPNTFTAGNIDIVVSDGNKTFTANYYGEDATPEFRAALQSYSCGSWSYLRVDTEGNIIGNGKVSTELRGIQIAKNTLYANYKEATLSDPQMITFSFTVSRLENDSNLKMVEASSIADDVDILNLVDLTAATLAPVSGTTTTVNVTAVSSYGDIFSPVPAEGLIDAADWYVFNTNTVAVVTVTSVDVIDEDTGEYRLNFAAQTASDVVDVKLELSSGYESNTVQQTL